MSEITPTRSVCCGRTNTTFVRAELEGAAPVLSFRDRGFSERNLANASDSRLDSEESLGWFDILDKMEVEKEDEACCLRCGFGITFKQKSCVSNPRII